MITTVVVGIILLVFGYGFGHYRGRKNVIVTAKQLEVVRLEWLYSIPAGQASPMTQAQEVRMALLRMIPQLMQFVEIRKLAMLDMRQRQRYQVELYVGVRRAVENPETKNGKEKQ